jgi:hypothetical protein
MQEMRGESEERKTSLQTTGNLNMDPDKPMKEPFDIEPFKAEQEVIRLTIAQIQKDFGMFGIDVDFPVDMEMVYHDLFRELEYHISDLLSRNVQKVAALLYQIDLDEKTILAAWEAHPDFTHAQVITELIIYRELKKVLFRNYYKQYKLKDLPEE